MAIKCGIVGLPNVGKSTLFNALTSAEIAAENYPFCTIEPNVGIVPVPDPRLAVLAGIVQPQKTLSDYDGICRHSRSCCGCIERRRTRQPVSRQYSRDQCHRACRSMFRERRCCACDRIRSIRSTISKRSTRSWRWPTSSRSKSSYTRRSATPKRMKRPRLPIGMC